MAFTPHHSMDDAADAVALAKGDTITADFESYKTGKFGETEIDKTYAKMEWDNFYVISPKTAQHLQQYKGSGYFTGLTSGKQDAYNGEGSGCSIHVLSGTFTMESVEMTAVFDKSMTVEIYAFDSHFHVKHDIRVTINDAKPTLIKLDWTGVTEVDWQVKSEKEDPVWANKGDEETDIAFDDLKYSNITGKSSASVQATHQLAQSYAALHGHLDLLHSPAHSDVHALAHAIA